MKTFISLALFALASARPAAEPLEAADAASLYPGAKLLASGIEGCSVDRSGEVYAVNATHFISLSGTTQQPLLVGNGHTNHFASSRFTRTLGPLVGDAKAHQLLKKDGSPLFANAEMLQPNDFTISSDEKRIYLSGMNYTANTGDVWYYDVATAKATRVELPQEPKTYRLNGIELSPDDRNLYVTCAQNSPDMKSVLSAVILKFRIDPLTGIPVFEKVALDLHKVLTDQGLNPQDPKGLKLNEMDPDGMRMDARGTLFMTLNAFHRVLKWDTNRTPCSVEVINLKTIVNPTNLELGGKGGQDLVVIGRCEANKEQSCVDVYKHNVPGRAFTNLNKAGGRGTSGCANA